VSCRCEKLQRLAVQSEMTNGEKEGDL
jgi:hypothetical protein